MRLYEILMSLLKQVTKDLHLRENKNCDASMKDPFEEFCKQHDSHHLTPQLKIYPHAKNGKEEEKTMNKILREDWRSFLAQVQPKNITSIYKFIRKRDGREPRTYTF